MGVFETDYPPGELIQTSEHLLQVLGAYLPVSVELLPADIEAFRRAQLPIPSPIGTLALIDTGASMTIVDHSIKRRLDPVVYGTHIIKGVGETKSHKCSRFGLRINIAGLAPFDVDTGDLEVHGKTGLEHVILGRDFLRGKTFLYDGKEGSIRIVE